MNKKQVILSISSMLSIATLILAETPEEKCLRKQIYANQVELTAKDKPVAIKIINNHVKKCKERLDSEQGFFKRLETFLPVVGGVLFLVPLVIMYPVVVSSTTDNPHLPGQTQSFEVSRKAVTPLMGYWTMKDGVSGKETAWKIENLKYDLKCRAICLVSSIAMCAVALLCEYVRRNKIKRLENSLNCDIQVLERLNSMQNQNVT